MFLSDGGCIYEFIRWSPPSPPLTSTTAWPQEPRTDPMTHSIRLWFKLRSTGFESRPDRMFVIRVVHIKCSKLFKGLVYAVLAPILCTVMNP